MGGVRPRVAGEERPQGLAQMSSPRGTPTPALHGPTPHTPPRPHCAPQMTGTVAIGPDGKSIAIAEEDGLDYAAVTLQLPGGERVPFLFSVKVGAREEGLGVECVKRVEGRVTGAGSSPFLLCFCCQGGGCGRQRGSSGQARVWGAEVGAGCATVRYDAPPTPSRTPAPSNPAPLCRICAPWAAPLALRAPLTFPPTGGPPSWTPR